MMTFFLVFKASRESDMVARFPLSWRFMIGIDLHLGWLFSLNAEGGD
jgi:hypothetical protein